MQYRSCAQSLPAFVYRSFPGLRVCVAQLRHDCTTEVLCPCLCSSKNEIRFAGLTQEQIAAAAKHKFECRQAAKRNRPNPSSDHLDPRAALFCRSIKTSSAAAQHTVDNADSARSQMFALHNSFGKPTWYAFSIVSLI